MAVTCAHCSKSFETASSKARFCSAKCRKLAFQARQNDIRTLQERSGPVEPVIGTTVEAVRAALKAADRLDSFRGQAALRLAERIDVSTAVMGFAPLVKQLEATMDAALDGVSEGDSPVERMRDELATRRAQRSA